MRVTDLIPWRQARGSEPAGRGDRDPVAVLQSDVNRALADFLRPFGLMPFSSWPASPADSGLDIKVDVNETDKEVRVTAELPGINEDDIDIRVSDGMLVISAEKKIGREVNERGYMLRERSFGHVERAVALPDGVDPNAAQATFKDGVLTVTIPKTAQAGNGAKRVPVRPN